MPIVFGGTVESVAKKLMGYPKPGLDAFLAATGGPAADTIQKSSQSAAEVIVRGERVQRLLAGLPAGPRVLAHIVATGPQRTHAGTIAEIAAARAHIAPADVTAGLQILAKSGLVVVAAFGTVDVLPDLIRATGEGTAAQLAGITPDQSPCLPLPFLVAAVLSLVAEDPPRLTRSNRPHARWLAKFEERLVAHAATPQAVYRAFNAAAHLGILTPEVDSDVLHLLPAPGRADRVFSLPHDDLTVLLASANARTKLAAAVVGRAFARSPSGVLGLGDVHAAAEEFADLDWMDRLDFDLNHRPSLFEVAELLGAAEYAGLAELARGERITTVSRAKPPSGTARWTVLPNFRVLVPADVDLRALCRLGVIARLERMDRVAEFSLDRQSVARRTRYDLAKSAVEILEEQSAFEVPEVVRREVAAWDKAPLTVRSFFGGVFVADSPAQAEALRAPALKLREIAPGVFFSKEAEVGKARLALRKLGLRVTKADDDEGEMDDAFDGGDNAVANPVEQARRLHASIARAAKADPRRGGSRAHAQTQDPLAAARVVSAPESGAPAAAAAGPAGSVTSEPSGQKQRKTRKQTPTSSGRTVADLALDFPSVFAACSGNLDLMRRACALSTADLKLAAHGNEGSVIARSIHLLSLMSRDGATADDGASPSAQSATPSTSAPPTQTPAKPKPAPAAGARAAPKPAGTAPTPAPTFRPVPAGELRSILESAAAKGADVTVIYTSKDGNPKARTIVPLHVKDARGVIWIEAIEPALGESVASFRLDRMSAVKKDIQG